MAIDPTFLVLLAVMVLTSYACRAGGFWLMRFVTATPRLDAALKATPVAVMAGIVTPAALAGRPGELVALALVAAVMRLSGNEVLAALSGIAGLALWRAIA
ncbi:AzlD family protein [Phreatobacter sp. AB_2022a]|uniref:AzlD family protein n=1 Tax=Phreatobacter sp. AB_2022a TaxID=3003134 RepID=UPI0022876AC6|nr:AzlD domain-containing protein [Phreatobacter sp. AB_2022a]MCZ0736211.1 AzlD domain-containing protein [Phreatobacter sp. AB_2022a]